MGEFFVYNKNYAGKCYWTEKRSRVSSIFTYDGEYISGKDNWAIDPELLLLGGAQPLRYGLPSAFRDAAPDRWGQTLIRHRHMRSSRENAAPMRTISEVDYLMGVSDFTRQDDLRFSLEKGGAFEHPSDDVPRLVSLPKLLNAAHRYTLEQDEDAIKFLLDAGSASLGGARPKAAVSDGEHLFISKFPHRHDKWDIMAWEWVSLSVARDAGILVPENKLVSVDGQNVLLVKRFDRIGVERVSYISMMSMLGLVDGQNADYSEITERIRDVSVCVKDDLRELYRRIVLSLLLNNTDDHLRNHGFLRVGSGFRLSPIFDVNPNPISTEMRTTSVFGEIEKTAALNALSNNINAFDLFSQEADTISFQVTEAVKASETYAIKAGIKKPEIKYMLNSLGL